MAYKNNKLFHNSEDFTVKTFCNETMTLINEAGISVIVDDFKLIVLKL